ncbi:hypothetical protein EIN_469410 [Entamoeba invadens IP1]|uniref:Uncharacterized protein n=1 Tax=Entamoeba invadens IP1 TaxID=370355 RepID=A0A0A1TUJ7_ENTIV|nr:hypothetical protein EIN_469410 [Entamoeba invadens IP1]ELP83737.1 hypothetical protein EIN_469410 [Entamoeba invadens IP1]|eukprot:XP_004183083.1 hypothetical protein EIN_469410 [Entamoeba invadens IP1]
MPTTFFPSRRNASEYLNLSTMTKSIAVKLTLMSKVIQPYVKPITKYVLDSVVIPHSCPLFVSIPVCRTTCFSLIICDENTKYTEKKIVDNPIQANFIEPQQTCTVFSTQKFHLPPLASSHSTTQMTIITPDNVIDFIHLFSVKPKFCRNGDQVTLKGPDSVVGFSSVIKVNSYKIKREGPQIRGIHPFVINHAAGWTDITVSYHNQNYVLPSFIYVQL